MGFVEQAPSYSPMDYDKLDISRYDKARALPAETLAQWAGAIRDAVPPAGISTVVDLGCGTGRFTQLLSRVYDAEIIGIDPSQKMLAQAAPLAGDLIRFLQGSAESVPLPDHSADLVFLSMVWHHVEDKDRALAEFRRMLARSGYVILRTASRETNDKIELFRFFPGALEIERQRIQTRPEIRETFEYAGFSTIAERTLSQKFAGDPAVYWEKISLRNLSSLQALPNEEFERGIVALKRYCETLPVDHPIFEPVDLFAFQRRN